MAIYIIILSQWFTFYTRLDRDRVGLQPTKTYSELDSSTVCGTNILRVSPVNRDQFFGRGRKGEWKKVPGLREQDRTRIETGISAWNNNSL